MRKNNFFKLISVIRTYKNWPTYLKDYLVKKIVGQTSLLETRAGPKFITRPLTVDNMMVNEVFNYKSYPVPASTSNKIIVDVGAHIGSFTVYAKHRCPNSTIFAYEPSKENFNLLRFNLALNNITGVRGFNLAIAGRPGIRNFYLTANCAENGFNSVGAETKVKCITLNQIMKINKLTKIDLLKLDCEGAEVEILNNAHLDNIETIIIEYHSEKIKNKLFHILVKRSIYNIEYSKNTGIITSSGPQKKGNINKDVIFSFPKW